MTTMWTRRSSETISEDATCFGQSATKMGQALLYFLLVTLLQIIVNPCNPLVWVFLLICEFVTSIERSLILFKHSTTKATTLMKAMLSKKKNAAAWCVTVWQIKILNILLQHTFCREHFVFSQHLRYLSIMKLCYFQLHKNLIWIPAL